MFPNERAMQDQISRCVSESGGSLADLIEKTTFSKGKSLEEEVIVESYSYCLNSLYDAVLVSENKNISAFDNEELRPDFLFYDPGYERFVIVELKNAKSATRQAGTELGAYANALKTHLPMIADGDIVFVVISSIWPALLKNYLFNEIFWKGRRILCLEAFSCREGFVKLRCLPPKELFHKSIVPLFGRKSFSGVQYCIYGKRARPNKCIDDLDSSIEQIVASFERIVRKAGQNNSHGFAFLWKDYSRYSQARYSITFVDINPYEKFHRSIVDINSDFSERLFRVISEYESSGTTGTTLDSVRHGDFLLKDIAEPFPEGSGYWIQLKDRMLRESELISFRSWGLVADLYDQFLSDVYAGSIEDARHDCPFLGLKFTENLIASENSDDGQSPS